MRRCVTELAMEPRPSLGEADPLNISIRLSKPFIWALVLTLGCGSHEIDSIRSRSGLNRLWPLLDDAVLFPRLGFATLLRSLLVERLIFASVCPNDTLALVVRHFGNPFPLRTDTERLLVECCLSSALISGDGFVRQDQLVSLALLEISYDAGKYRFMSGGGVLDRARFLQEVPSDIIGSPDLVNSQNFSVTVTLHGQSSVALNANLRRNVPHNEIHKFPPAPSRGSSWFSGLIVRELKAERRLDGRERLSGSVMASESWMTILGLGAATLTSLSYVPQVIKAFPRGETGDISLKMLIALLAGLLLWVVYGLLKTDLVIVAANGVGSLLVGAVLAFKLRDLAGA